LVLTNQECSIILDGRKRTHNVRKGQTDLGGWGDERRALEPLGNTAVAGALFDL